MKNKILAPISVGELFDKITILEIKKDKVTNHTALSNIMLELSELNSLVPMMTTQLLDKLKEQLKTINQYIWSLEDDIRSKEKENLFDQRFIELAREIYKSNDERARIKKLINLETNSLIHEEKVY